MTTQGGGIQSWTLRGVGGAGTAMALDILRGGKPGDLGIVNASIADTSVRDLVAWTAMAGNHKNLLAELGLAGELETLQLADTAGGATKQPLVGMYHAYKRFMLDQGGRSEGTMLTRFLETAQGNAYTFALTGGTGAGVTPTLIRVRKKRDTYHVAFAVYDPLVGSEEIKANNLFGFVTANEYADMVVLVENLEAFEAHGGSTLLLSPSYLGTVLGREYLENTEVHARTRCKVANEYVARMFWLFANTTRDAGDLNAYYRATGYSAPRSQANGAGSSQPDSGTSVGGAPPARWALPCIYPLETEGVPCDEFGNVEVTFPFMALAALKEGQLCSGTKIHSAKYAVVVCQIPEGVDDRVVHAGDVRNAVARATNLDPGRVTLFIRARKGNLAQVMVLLGGAGCAFFDYLSKGSSARRDLEQNWAAQLDVFRQPSGAESQPIHDRARDLVLQEVNRLDPFRRFDELYEAHLALT